MTAPLPPSGQQFEIRYGDQVAVVTEVGATLRRYAVGDVEVLDGFAEAEVCGGGRGQHLLPWPNRVRDGRYTHLGVAQQLALTEPAHRNAIHGLTRWVGWQLVTQSDTEVTLGLTLHPQPGWPGVLELTITTGLGPKGLSVRTSATNAGATSVPYGTGAHPYFRVGSGLVDAVVLTVPADSYLLPDDRGIPVDPQPVAGSAYDFRSPRRLGDLVLDTAYADVRPGADGRWQVVLAGEGGDDIVVWGDAAYTWLQLFTGDTLAPDKARAGLAVEPMTCGPDAFNTGAGLVVLEPGESHHALWGVTARAATP